MQILNLKQGSDEWLEARLEHFTASEAPAMMNQSKFMSRNQLLALKKGWQNMPHGRFKEQLFQKGHLHEDQARPIAELDAFADLPPVVGSIDYRGMKLLASFDGYSLHLIWEHKDWNVTLAENVKNQIIEKHYYWQLEHQMLVAGLKKIQFTVSDGTRSNRETFTYHSTQERRIELIEGWQQFEKDLKDYELKAIEEKVVPESVDSFPMIEYQLEGSELTTNALKCLDNIKHRAAIEINRTLETDQDFANKDVLNKATKKARTDFKNSVEEIKSKFEAFSTFSELASEIDRVLQKMQSSGEKQVTQAKLLRKQAIINEGHAMIQNHISLMNKEFGKVVYLSVYPEIPDFIDSVRNKRTIETIQNAVDSEVSKYKLDSVDRARNLRENFATLLLYNQYRFLLNDENYLLAKDNADLVPVVKTRIADYLEEQKIEDAKKLEKAVDNGATQKRVVEERTQVVSAIRPDQPTELDRAKGFEQFWLHHLTTEEMLQNETQLQFTKRLCKLSYITGRNSNG